MQIQLFYIPYFYPQKLLALQNIHLDNYGIRI